jgi:hypothetical protein
MFYKKQRNAQYIAELKFFLEDRYGFEVKQIIEAKRGFYGETWKVIAESECFFIKIVYYAHHMAKYSSSLNIMDYMVHHGITFIGRIVRSKQDDLCCLFNGGTLGVFVFVEGENTEEYDLPRLMSHLAVIYHLQTGDLAIKPETFDVSCIDAFFQQFSDLKLLQSQSAVEIVGILEDNRAKLHHYAIQLRSLAGLCAKDPQDFHITSGDVGGNVILDGDHFTIVDWDDIVLAPIERDLWWYMQDEGWMRTIQETLSASGFAYRLAQDRLAFYCIRGFFHYLCEYLHCFLECDGEELKKDVADAMREYMGADFFMNVNLMKADAICVDLFDSAGQS